MQAPVLSAFPKGEEDTEDGGEDEEDIAPHQGSEEPGRNPTAVRVRILSNEDANAPKSSTVNTHTGGKKPIHKIISSTVASEAGQIDFGALSHILSCVPTISSETGRAMQPILDAILEEEGGEQVDGGNTENAENSAPLPADESFRCYYVNTLTSLENKFTYLKD